MKQLYLRMTSMDINESVYTRKSFVAVAVVPCEWGFNCVPTTTFQLLKYVSITVSLL